MVHCDRFTMKERERERGVAKCMTPTVHIYIYKMWIWNLFITCIFISLQNIIIHRKDKKKKKI